MAYQLITCPETAHLEMIEYQDDGLGRIIQACSRFRPPCCLRCPRTCAARMDRRDHPRTDKPGDDPTIVELRRRAR